MKSRIKGPTNFKSSKMTKPKEKYPKLSKPKNNQIFIPKSIPKKDSKTAMENNVKRGNKKFTPRKLISKEIESKEIDSDENSNDSSVLLSDINENVGEESISITLKMKAYHRNFLPSSSKLSDLFDQVVHTEISVPTSAESKKDIWNTLKTEPTPEIGSNFERDNLFAENENSVLSCNIVEKGNILKIKSNRTSEN